MSCWSEYIAYLKDNPEGYWFKRKLYGYGWTPATWQGWTVMGVYLLFVFTLTLVVAPQLPESELLEVVLLPVFGATAVLLAITWKTGESLKWQWGKLKD